MNSWTARPILLVLVTAAACSQPPAQPQTQTTPAAPAPVAEPAPKSEAILRADALLEDLRRREAAQAQFDRQVPAPAAIPSLASSPASRPAPSAATIAAESQAATDAPAAESVPDSAAPADPARDASWWKEQMRTLQLALDGALAKLAEAEKENYKYGYNDLQAEYKRRLAAVADARLAIERLHNDARRARVPPGWLRWP
jgi:hypothetical protein